MCKADFARAPKDPRHDGFVNKMILRCDKSFLMEIPIWVFSEAVSTPSVYPLRGTVVALKQHYVLQPAEQPDVHLPWAQHGD